MTSLIDFILHIDVHLDQMVRDYHAWTYAILFIIVFAETGFVITPFLPGDSLLFAAGAIAARTNVLDPLLLSLLLTAAAIIGDAVNYAVGFFFGQQILARDSRLIRRAHVERTERFFARYGGKTIIFARFVPIVRTFAPFLAGLGRMQYRRFALYNVLGGFIWVFTFIYAGFTFGELEYVRKNFTMVILGIIVVSFIPAVVELLRARQEAKAERPRTAADSAGL